MSLNTIELPEFLVAELYRNSLLATDSAAFAKGQASAGGPVRTQMPTAKPTEPKPTESKSNEPKSNEPKPAAPKDKSSSGYKFLGNNGRRVTLVVNCPGVAYLPDDQLAFLSKMLEACKMNMGDVALINQAAAPVIIGTLKTQLQPATLVLFGIEPIGINLPINFPQYKIQAFDDCNYLYASPLEELVRPTDEGKLLKTKLWVCLKQLFEV